MRTNIILDDELIEKALRCSGLKTKKEVVNYALREIVNRNKRKKILELKGKVEWIGDLDEMRKSRF